MTLYQWTTRDNHPTCQALDGQQRTLDQWRMSILPGHHKKCTCTLSPITTIGQAITNPAADMLPIKPAHFPTLLTSITGDFAATAPALAPIPATPRPDP